MTCISKFDNMHMDLHDDVNSFVYSILSMSSHLMYVEDTIFLVEPHDRVMQLN